MNTLPPDADNARQFAAKYAAEALARAKGIRVSYALIAFCLAVTLWYTVTVRDKVDSWVDVQVVFKGAPDNLIISDGLINKLSVRIRAARGLSRSLTGRDASVVVDLSSITRGSNAIAVTRDMLPFNSAYEVMEVSPSRILVMADIRSTKEITLETGFDGKLAPDLFVKSIRINPQKLVASGPESMVSGISRIRIPVPLTLDMPAGDSSVSVAVPAPANVALSPPQVTVELEIGVRTRQVKLTRSVTAVNAAEGASPAVRPGVVTITAEIPESLARDEKKLADLVTAGVVLPKDLGAEERSAPVSVTLPPNAELISVTPSEVRISLPPQKP